MTFHISGVWCHGCDRACWCCRDSPVCTFAPASVARCTSCRRLESTECSVPEVPRNPFREVSVSLPLCLSLSLSLSLTAPLPPCSMTRSSCRQAHRRCGALAASTRRLHRFCVPRRPYHWCVNKHGCHQFANEQVSLAERDWGPHLQAFLYLWATNMPGGNRSVMRIDEDQTQRMLRAATKNERDASAKGIRPPQASTTARLLPPRRELQMPWRRRHAVQPQTVSSERCLQQLPKRLRAQSGHEQVLFIPSLAQSQLFADHALLWPRFRPPRINPLRAQSVHEQAALLPWQSLNTRMGTHSSLQTNACGQPLAAAPWNSMTPIATELSEADSLSLSLT